MQLNRNIGIGLLAVALLGIGTILIPSKSSPTISEVPASLLTVAANTNAISAAVLSAANLTSSKKKVLNLELDPENVITLNTEIDEYSVEDVIRRIQKNELENEDLYIILDCPGGSVFAGARLISYMESAKINVNTIVYGLAASMCAHIHAHGDKRYVLDRSTLMYHQASGGVQGTVKGMKNLLGYVDRTVQKLDAYIADRAGIPRKEFDDLVSVDLWIDGEDAVAKGLADSLVTVNVRNARLHGEPALEENILEDQTAVKSIIEQNPLKNFR